MIPFLATLALVQSPAPDAFMTEAKAAGAVYDPIARSNRALLLEGRLADSTRALLDAVPEAKRTAAHSFVLGNMLFTMDPDVSFKLHEKAHADAPGEGLVTFEYAIELHRKKKHAEAEKLYAALTADHPPMEPQVRALRADCLLRLARNAEAVAEWEAAKPKKNHSELEAAACWVYGPLSPETKRCAMLAEIGKGSLDRVEELVLLDLRWERDWWNADVNPPYLEHDLALAATKLGKESARYRELELMANAMRGGSRMQRDMEKAEGKPEPVPFDLAAGAKTLGLLGEKPKLAEKSLVASHLFQHFIEDELATAADLSKWFEKDLRARAESKAGDVDAWEMLAAIYAETQDPKLADVDRLVWERHHDKRFGGSLLAGKGAELKPDDPALLEALKRFPDDPQFAQFAVECAKRENKPAVEAMSRYVAASFANMASYRDTQMGFTALKKELEGAAKK